jgi:trehalose 6-phosphate synthase
MQGTRNRVLSVAGLAATLVLVFLLAHWIAFTVASGWYQADLAGQSRLAVRGSQEALNSALSAGDRESIDSLAAAMSADEAILGAAICVPSLQILATGGNYPAAVLPCDSLRTSIERDPPGSGETWYTVLAASTGLQRSHLSIVTVTDSAGSTSAYVAVLQSLSGFAGRATSTRTILFIALAAMVIVGWMLLAASLRMATREWVRGLKRALRGETASAEYRPLLREIRDIVGAAGGGDGASPSPAHWTRERLRRLLRDRLRDEHVIVVANREPFIHERVDDSIRVVRPASGLVTALDPVMRSTSGVWIAHGAGSADRETADSNARLLVPPGEESYTLRRVWMSAEEEQGFYYGFANEGLWPLCHLVHVRPSFRAADWDSYVAINRRFANAVSEETDRKDPIVMVNDYHFALAPRFVRELLPEAIILVFWHIPWPDPERFGISPWREELLDGLLGADIVGFHTQAHCNNFMDSVDAYLESRTDRGDRSVNRHGRSTLVRPYPISVAWPPAINGDVPDAPSCRGIVLEELNVPADTILAIGVDRLDYTKGLNERMLAVEILLERAPDLVGRFVLAQLAAPSRTQLGRYQELGREVRETANRINARFGRDDYTPIRLLVEHHGQQRTNMYYRAANICYVSSLHDGMNLVAKEFVSARTDECGVLVLSQFTGAARELGDAVLINPFATDDFAEALYRALTMPLEEQQQRMRRMRQQVQENNVYRWGGELLSMVGKVADARQTPEPPP